MSAGQFDITVEQGADLRVTLYCKNSDDDPVDFTGYTARAMLRAGSSFSVDLAPTITDAANGQIEIVILGAVTAAWSGWSRGAWDLEVEDGAGSVIRVVEGVATLSVEQTYG